MLFEVAQCMSIQLIPNLTRKIYDAYIAKHRPFESKMIMLKNKRLVLNIVDFYSAKRIYFYYLRTTILYCFHYAFTDLEVFSILV
jgi:hypothetical protein